MTGRSSIENDTTFGSTPDGSVDLMRLIACWIFCSAVARSVPYVKDACTIDAFVVDVAVVDSSPGMPWIAVSTGVETSLFTTSGDAPG